MQSIIISGGKGERLGSVTKSCPKGMVEIAGKPLLEYQINWLKNSGVEKIVFACGYLHEQIQDYFKDGKKFSIDIDYSVENEPLGRGGAIKQAWGKLNPNEKVVVTNGDIYTALDLVKTVNAHVKKVKEKSIKGTVCLFTFKSQYGIVKTDKNDLIEKFEEKPTLPFWINGGVYVFEHDVKDHLPDKGDHETTTFPEFAKSGLLYGYRSNEYWKSIETVKDINEFASYVSKKIVV